MPLDRFDELFYWVDEADVVLGSVKRGVAHQDPSKIHRAVSIVLVNSTQQTLLQKRSSLKDTYPKYWTVSASGHVDFGLSYQEAALKELKEELGLSGVSLKENSKRLVHFDHETEIETIYTGKTNQNPSKLDPYEVTETMWLDLDRLSDFVNHYKITPAAIEVYKTLGFI